jgi:hypothetical protein
MIMRLDHVRRARCVVEMVLRLACADNGV